MGTAVVRGGDGHRLIGEGLTMERLVLAALVSDREDHSALVCAWWRGIDWRLGRRERDRLRVIEMRAEPGA